MHLQRWILLGKRLCNAVSDRVHVICMHDSKSNFESVLLRKQPAINNPVLGYLDHLLVEYFRHSCSFLCTCRVCLFDARCVVLSFSGG